METRGRSSKKPAAGNVQLSSELVLNDTTPIDVLLYYPNLIGYTRVMCMVISFYYARSDWKKTVAFYLAAFVGDVLDGYVARHFNQCTKFLIPDHAV